MDNPHAVGRVSISLCQIYDDLSYFIPRMNATLFFLLKWVCKVWVNTNKYSKYIVV